ARRRSSSTSRTPIASSESALALRLPGASRDSRRSDRARSCPAHRVKSTLRTHLQDEEDHMRDRLAIILASTALVVALFGATPLGQAAGPAISSVPPFAKRAGFATRAGHAKVADTATNAKLVAGHGISTTPKAGDIPIVGPDGKLPASIGAAGPQGAQ